MVCGTTVLAAPSGAEAQLLEPGVERVVVLGDSFSAGIGAISDDVSTDDVTCAHVSTRWAPGLRIAAAYRVPSFMFACGGADLDIVADQWKDAMDVIPGDGTGTLIVMTAGGNSVESVDEADWPELIVRCSIWPNCEDEPDNKVDNWSAIHNGMRDLIASIVEERPGAIVRVMGYPQLFQPTADCEGAFGFDAEEAAFADENSILLNRMIERAVEREGTDNVEYLDPAPYFEGHGACEGRANSRYINGLVDTPSSRFFEAAGNSYHPTWQGYSAYYDLLEDSLAFSDIGWLKVPAGFGR